MRFALRKMSGVSGFEAGRWIRRDYKPRKVTVGSLTNILYVRNSPQHNVIEILNHNPNNLMRPRLGFFSLLSLHSRYERDMQGQ